MKLLLDTHIVLWWFGDRPELSGEARTLIRENEIFVSTVTPWEIAIKKSVRKLDAPDDFIAMMQRHAFKHLPIDVQHALATETLPLLHQDPFDRMLVAQATSEGMKLLTHDAKLRQYGEMVITV